MIALQYQLRYQVIEINAEHNLRSAMCYFLISCDAHVFEATQTRAEKKPQKAEGSFTTNSRCTGCIEKTNPNKSWNRVMHLHTKVRRQMRKLPCAAIHKALLFLEVVVQDIQNKYEAQGEKERQVTARILTGNVLKNTRKYHKIGRIGRWKNDKNVKMYYTNNRNSVSDSLISRVRSFYSRDDVSRITTGKRQNGRKRKWKNGFFWIPPTFLDCSSNSECSRHVHVQDAWESGFYLLFYHTPSAQLI